MAGLAPNSAFESTSYLQQPSARTQWRLAASTAALCNSRKHSGAGTYDTRSQRTTAQHAAT